MSYKIKDVKSSTDEDTLKKFEKHKDEIEIMCSNIVKQYEGKSKAPGWTRWLPVPNRPAICTKICYDADGSIVDVSISTWKETN